MHIKKMLSLYYVKFFNHEKNQHIITYNVYVTIKH